MALCLLQLLVVVLVLAMWEQLWFCWYFSVAQVVLLDIYVPQLSAVSYTHLTLPTMAVV